MMKYIFWAYVRPLQAHFCNTLNVSLVYNSFITFNLYQNNEHTEIMLEIPAVTWNAVGIIIF